MIKYILILVVLLGCKEKYKFVTDKNSKLWEVRGDSLYDVPISTYTIREDLTVTKDTAPTLQQVFDSDTTNLFKNDTISLWISHPDTIYIHDTIYKTRVKFDTIYERFYELENNTNIEQMPIHIEWDTTKTENLPKPQ